tara:strand:- start:247 stop:762 length:516 start_codon:yes stop_codon:yes gene_type:complete
MKLVLALSVFIICSMFWIGCGNNSVPKEMNPEGNETQIQATVTVTPERTESPKPTKTATVQSSQESEIPAEVRIESGSRCEEIHDTYYDFDISAQNMGQKDISNLYMTVDLVGDDGSVVNSVNSVIIPSLPQGATVNVSGILDTFSQTVVSCQVKFTDENGDVNFQGNLND